MPTKTVGFAIAEEDAPRLDHLVAKYGGGNRSAFLRTAIAYMEAADRAERLQRIQAYGAGRSVEQGIGLDDIEGIVHRVLSGEGR